MDDILREIINICLVSVFVAFTVVCIFLFLSIIKQIIDEL